MLSIKIKIRTQGKERHSKCIKDQKDKKHEKGDETIRH